MARGTLSSVHVEPTPTASAATLLTVAAVAVAMLGLAANLDLTFDETYYALWARMPAASYLDHPPLVAWLLAAVAPFGPHEWLTRLPMLLCGALAALGMYGFAITVWTAEVAQRTLLTCVASLPWLWASVLISPDGPLLAAWCLALWAYARALRVGTVGAWLTLGVALGAAHLSKYMAVLFWPAMLGHLLWRAPHLLRRARTWLPLLVTAVMGTPVIIWNLQHRAASLRFQTSLGPRHLDGQSGLWTLAEFVAGQIVWVGPVLMWCLMRGVRQAWKNRANPGVSMALMFGGAPALFFLVLSLRHALEVNWALCVWPAMMALAAWLSPRVASRQVVQTAAVLLGAAVYLMHPFADPQHDFTARFFGWRNVAASVDSCASHAGLHRYAVVTSSRREATQMAYYGANHPPAKPIQDPYGRFDILPADAFLGQDLVLLLNTRDARPEVAESLAAFWGAQVVQWCAPVVRRHVDGQPVERFVPVALRSGLPQR